jgi:hypothetical protein
VARHEDVLSVPVTAVVEIDQGTFCWVESIEGVERRSLQLGDSNDEFIVVDLGDEPTARFADTAEGRRFSHAGHAGSLLGTGW